MLNANLFNNQNAPGHVLYNKFKKWYGSSNPLQQITPATKSTTNRLSRRVRRLEKGVTGKERKTHDSAVAGNPIATGTVTHLSGMAQGDTSLTREGLKTKPLSIEWRGSIAMNILDFSPSVACRQIIFIDKAGAGGTPVVTDILESAQINSLFKHENRFRFRILKDNTYVAYRYNGTDNLQTSYFKGYVRLPRNLICQYTGTSAAVTSSGQNSIWVLNLSSLTANGPHFDVNYRLRFTG